MRFGGMAAAVTKRLSKRAHGTKQEQALRLDELYAGLLGLPQTCLAGRRSPPLGWRFT